MEMARHVSLNALCLSKSGWKGRMFQRGGCGKWRVSALQKRQAEETVNAQRRPLTEITPPLYNRMLRLYGGQEVKREHCRSSNKQT